MKLTVGSAAPPAPKPIDKNRAYRPRPKKDKPLVPCAEAMPFLECFCTNTSVYQKTSQRDICVISFRTAAKCGYEPERVLVSAERYSTAGGDDWTATDWKWAKTCLAALKDHPESALALAKQCVEEYGKRTT